MLRFLLFWDYKSIVFKGSKIFLLVIIFFFVVFIECGRVFWKIDFFELMYIRYWGV